MNFPIIINANDHIGSGFPIDRGKNLAEYLIENDLVWKDMVIDLQWLPAGTLIGAFFHSFSSRLISHDSSCRYFIDFIEWRVRYSYQEATIQNWIESEAR